MDVQITAAICGRDREAPARLPASGPRLSVRVIMTAAAAECGFEVADLYARGRRNDLCEARWLGWWTARQLFPKLSLPRLGQLSGGYHHTSVLYGVRQFQRLVAINGDVAALASAFFRRMAAIAAVRIDQIDEAAAALRQQLDQLEAEKADLIHRLNRTGDQA